MAEPAPPKTGPEDLSCYIWTPLKYVPEQIFQEMHVIFGPPLKNQFPRAFAHAAASSELSAKVELMFFSVGKVKTVFKRLKILLRD